MFKVKENDFKPILKRQLLNNNSFEQEQEKLDLNYEIQQNKYYKSKSPIGKANNNDKAGFYTKIQDTYHQRLLDPITGKLKSQIKKPHSNLKPVRYGTDNAKVEMPQYLRDEIERRTKILEEKNGKTDMAVLNDTNPQQKDENEGTKGLQNETKKQKRLTYKELIQFIEDSQK